MPANQILLWQRMTRQTSITKSCKTILPCVNWNFSTIRIAHAWEQNNHPSIYETQYSRQNSHWTPGHQQMLWTGPTVCMVAWFSKIIGRVGQKLSRMLSSIKAMITNIGISWTSIAKSCHRFIRMEKQELSTYCWLLSALYRNHFCETDNHKRSNQTHKKQRIC